MNMIRSISKSLYIGIAVAVLASCNASDETLSSNPTSTRTVTLNMQVGVSAGVSSRELTAWDGAQQVNDMRIYVFRCPKDKKNTTEETFTYFVPDDLKAVNKGYYSVTAFDNKEPYYSYQHGNKPQQFSYEITPYLPNNYYYQFLAVGRDDKYMATAERKLDEIKLTDGTTTLQDVKIALTDAAVNSAKLGALNCTEFFSGRLQDLKTKADNPILVEQGAQHFNCILTATRNVAGMIMYVTNIPTVVDDNTQDLTTPVSFTPTKLSIEVTGIEGTTMVNGKTAPNDADNLVNKIASATGYLTLGVIELTSANGWSKDDTKKVFTRPADTDKGWFANSYMVSNFMLPTPVEYMLQSKNYDKSKVTFMLHYSDNEGHHRYDNIKDRNTERILFPIEANHLYSLGIKTSNANEPFDLNKNYQPTMMNMTIELEPAFEKKHEFETE